MRNFVHQYYLKEQEKKKENYKKSQIYLLNNQLIDILRRIEKDVDKEKWAKEIKEVDRALVQSHVWNIRYLNNLENEKVTVALLLFLEVILHDESQSHNKHHQQTIKRLASQLQVIDSSAYLQYRSQLTRRK